MWAWLGRSHRCDPGGAEVGTGPAAERAIVGGRATGLVPFVASLLLVAMPGAPSSFLLLLASSS